MHAVEDDGREDRLDPVDADDSRLRAAGYDASHTHSGGTTCENDDVSESRSAVVD